MTQVVPKPAASFEGRSRFLFFFIKRSEGVRVSSCAGVSCGSVSVGLYLDSGGLSVL